MAFSSGGITLQKGRLISTSLLYHTAGIRGYQYQRSSFEKGTATFAIKQDPDSICCPHRKSKDALRAGTPSSDTSTRCPSALNR